MIIKVLPPKFNAIREGNAIFIDLTFYLYIAHFAYTIDIPYIVYHFFGTFAIGKKTFLSRDFWIY